MPGSTGPSRDLHAWASWFERLSRAQSEPHTKTFKSLALLHRHNLFSTNTGRVRSLAASIAILRAKRDAMLKTAAKHPKAREAALRDLDEAEKLVSMYNAAARKAYGAAGTMNNLQKVHERHAWLDANRSNALYKEAAFRLKHKNNKGTWRLPSTRLRGGARQTLENRLDNILQRLVVR